MRKRPALSKSELEVARIVWELGKASVRQVLDALPTDRNLDFKTVQTYLRRLQSKGYLKTRLDGRTKIYCAKVRPDQVIREVLNDVVHRLFGGDSIPVFQHLIQDRGLNKEELRQLRNMLDEIEEEES